MTHVIEHALRVYAPIVKACTCTGTLVPRVGLVALLNLESLVSHLDPYSALALA